MTSQVSIKIHYFYCIGAEAKVRLEINDDDGDDLDVDPEVLVARGNRKGSRFAADGTPLCLWSFLESSSPG